ncbi:MAG: hypothetical protein R2739_08720 [Chitinophagales bacterium]|nr:hypothetical protein [Bacteroidota bacterium]
MLVSNKILLIIFVLSALFVSCTKAVTYDEYDYGYNYLPTDSGRFVIYKVDSILYNDFDHSRRYSSIYLKEKIGEQFTDNMGRNAKKILRYYSDTLTSNWEIFNVDYLVKTEQNVERVEDNLRYIKLTFPNDVNTKWLGNKLITIPPPYILDSTNYYLSDWKYTIKERDRHFNDGFQTFDSTLLVSQIQDSTAIYKTYSIEKYARNVGLVYKELWIVTGQINIGAPWEDRAEKGFIVKQYAIDYGKE